MAQPETLAWMTVPKFLEAHKGLISKNTLYEWLREGRVPHLKVGRKILLPPDALDRMLAEAGARAEAGYDSCEWRGHGQ
jgi:excisionase family DNA binding protein